MPRTVELTEAQERVLFEMQAVLSSLPKGSDNRPSRRPARMARMTAEAKLLGMGISRYTARGITQGSTPWIRKQQAQ